MRYEERIKLLDAEIKFIKDTEAAKEAAKAEEAKEAKDAEDAEDERNNNFSKLLLLASAQTVISEDNEGNLDFAIKADHDVNVKALAALVGGTIQASIELLKDRQPHEALIFVAETQRLLDGAMRRNK